MYPVVVTINDPLPINFVFIVDKFSSLSSANAEIIRKFTRTEIISCIKI